MSWELPAVLCLLAVSTGIGSFAQQTAPPQPPQSAPAAAPAQPAAQPPEPVPDASIPVPPEVPDTRAGQFSIFLYGWYAPTHPAMHTGKTAIPGASMNLDFPGKNQPLPGAQISFPTGRHHFLNFSYFRTRGSGNTTLTKNLNVFGSDYSAGDYLSAGYKLQNAKVSFDFLSWPFPVNNASFRIKTYWEAQYTSIKSTFDAPFKPTVDADGNGVQTSGSGTNWFIYPSLGMGIEKYVGNLRLAAKGSGFGIPHFAAVWDAEASMGYRMGQIELQVGYKAFYFKTSPRQELFLHQTLNGAFAGVRWYPK